MHDTIRNQIMSDCPSDPNVPPIIIVHDLLGTKRHWESMGKTLYNVMKRSVIIVDLRNHGDSPHVNSHKYKDVAQDVLHLYKKLAIRRATLVGHSVGGRTCMCAALMALDQDGYVVLEEFLRPAECDELRAAGAALAQSQPAADQRTVFSTAEGEKQQLRDKYFLESNDKISYFFEAEAVGPDGELTVDPSISLNKVGHALHLLDPLFRCYTYSDRVKSACRQLGLRDPAVVQSMYIYKNPGIGGEVSAHQDSTYLYTEPVPPVGFWIALEDATLQNGCLWMARGSHRSGSHRRLVRSADAAAGAPALVYDRPAPIYPQSSFTPLPVSKGTCVLIHGHVVHKSAPNRSDKSRHAYTFHVIEKHENKYAEDNWLQEGEQAPFLSLYTTPQIV